MAKPQSNRPQARVPRGFRDIDQAELRAQSRMLATIREVYESYGFEPLETPAVENIETLLGKGCELRLFDPHVNTARLVGANRRYIEQHIPHLARLMVESAEAAVSDTDIVLLGNINDTYLPALKTLTPAQRVIDLTSADRTPETAARYERLCG